MAVAGQRRRSKGTGGIFPIADDVWRVDVELPRTPGTPRRRLSRRVRGSKSEAEAVLADLVARRSSDTARSEVVTFGVRLPAEMADALRRAAADDGVSIAEEIRLAIADRVTGGR